MFNSARVDVELSQFTRLLCHISLLFLYTLDINNITHLANHFSDSFLNTSVFELMHVLTALLAELFNAKKCQF